MKHFLKKLINPKSKPVITIVSGLPRSGTSMMMKMLEAGGIPPLTDELREADVDNPKGYYEFERVKKLPDGDTAWLEEAQGKSVKIISALLKHLPDGYTYRILFMRRNLDEVVASQKKMLIHREEATDTVIDEELIQLFKKHLSHIETWVNTQSNVEFKYVDYNLMLTDPATEIDKVDQFLNGRLNITEMVKTVDLNLYRNRRQTLIPV